jgi:UDP-glucose:(heptosyl)LPS alpha-1,3-glucosyltransferase
MDTLFRATDVTVLPTYYDPASKVVIESLLHGVPAISTAYNGASQWIADPTGHNAWSSPLDHATTASTAAAKQEESAKRPAGRVIESPEDVEALCRAMADLCDDDERRRCAHATTHLDRRLQMDVHVEQLASLLAETAGLRNENQ